MNEGNIRSTTDAGLDLDRLRELADDNPAEVRSLVELYLQQTEQQLSQMRAAIQSHSADTLGRVAHSCAGASATCGMTPMVNPLKELEKRARSGTLDGADEWHQKALAEFARIRAALNQVTNAC